MLVCRLCPPRLMLRWSCVVALRNKIIALAIVPLIAAIVAIAIAVDAQARRLGDRQAEQIESLLLEGKREELVHAVTLVKNAIESMPGGDDASDRVKAKEIIAA